jgi:hypothetical protein
MAPRSRRALLTAAAGAAGALAAQAALPLTAAAAPANMQTELDNPTTATTSITDSGVDSTAFASHQTDPTGYGYGFEATSAGGGGVVAWSVEAPDPGWFTPDVVKYTGVFGSAPASTEEGYAGVGVWGDSPDFGVAGTGSVGVYGYGYYGVEGFGNDYDANSAGVRAVGSDTKFALRAEGKVRFSRSGRKSMSSGKSSLVITRAGVTSSSKVFAVLATSESGRWVRAVVPASGKFTVYLNTSLSSSAVVAWFVLD